jgi:hypothetical protein
MAALDAVVLDEVGVVFTLTLTLTHHLLLPRRVLHHYPFYALSSNNGPIISPPIFINPKSSDHPTIDLSPHHPSSSTIISPPIITTLHHQPSPHHPSSSTIIINHNHHSSIKADVLFPPPPRTTAKFRPKGGLRGGRDQSGKKTKKKEADCPTTKLLKFLAIYNEREELQVMLVVV